MLIGTFLKTSIYVLIISIIMKDLFSFFQFNSSVLDFFEYNWMSFVNYGLMILIFKLFISDEVRQRQLSNNILSIFLLSVVLYCIYIVSDVKFYIDILSMLQSGNYKIFGYSFFHPEGVVLAWVILWIANKNTAFQLNIPQYVVEERSLYFYFVVSFGTFFIIANDIVNLLIGAKSYLLQDNTFIIYWYSDFKLIIVDIFVVLVFTKISKYFQLKKANNIKLLLLLTALVLLVISMYSFRYFVLNLLYMVTMNFNARWDFIAIVFIPTLIGFYVMAKYLRRNS